MATRLPSLPGSPQRRGARKSPKLSGHRAGLCLIPSRRLLHVGVRPPRNTVSSPRGAATHEQQAPHSSYCWLGQTQCPAMSLQPAPSRLLAQVKPRSGYQWRPAAAAALCTHLGGQGDPGALGRPPTLCPRLRRPAARLHLQEGQSGL